MPEHLTKGASPEQKERARAANASKICPCGKDASDMLQPGVGSCSICHQHTCSAACSNRHHYTVHEQNTPRSLSFLAVNGFDDGHYADAHSRKGKR